MDDGQPADRRQGSATPGAAGTRRAQGLGRQVAAAVLVALCAGLLYWSTLLPGLDFGDTASFQSGVAAAIITPRDGYPLYFAVARLFLRFWPGNPAFAVNVGSAIEAALSSGLFVLVAIELSGSLLAAVGAALLFAGSYTFWSQSVIAEVYALHIALTLLSLLLLLRWAEQPTLTRLGWFFAVYALAFGNHLSTILLAPAFTLFILASAPGGWKSMLSPRVMVLALVCALAGVLQYTWNLRAFWMLPYPPHAIADVARRFWFDVTKADWRETLVMGVPQSMLVNRIQMYAFDLYQQFGWIGPSLAVAGLGMLMLRAWRLALLLSTLYVANVAFAFGYNVGDTHVFYLPSHLIVALLAAPGIVWLGSILEAPAVLSSLLLLYAGVRTYHDYPALDRGRDTRPTMVLSNLTSGIDDRGAILLTDLDWQVQNGLTYFGHYVRPEVAYTRAADVLPYLPRLLADNERISRSIVATARASLAIVKSYGPAVSSTALPRERGSLVSAIQGLPPGTRYVVSMLKPGRDFSIDWQDLGQSLMAAGDGRPVRVPDGDYRVVAGLSGRAPALVFGSNGPFDRRVVLDGVDTEIRMDGWLASDTIRRMGYGHVVAAHRHTLILERGISFVAFDAAGSPLNTAYAANLFAPETRYLIKLTHPGP